MKTLAPSVMRLTINITLLLICSFTNVFAIEYDTLFIESANKFAYKEFDVNLKGNLFTSFSQTNSPDYDLYVSLPFKVQNPLNTYSYSLTTTDKKVIKQTSMKYQKLGYSTFEYVTYGNSFCLLNDKLLSYSKESFSFIIFHELLHNYFTQENITIPNEFNEATCDLIGNYCTLFFSESSPSLQKDRVLKMIELNERIYETMNKYIEIINNEANDISKSCDQCSNELHSLSKEYDSFQNDRFNYSVNTAYLLKNNFYSKQYFILKKLFLKVKNVYKFLEIIKKLNGKNVQECEIYIMNNI